MGVDMGKILGGAQIATGIGATALGNPAVGLPLMGSGFQSVAGSSGSAGSSGTPPQQGPLANPMSQIGGALTSAGPAMSALGLGGGQQQQAAPQTPPPPAMAQRPMPTGSTAGGAMPMPSPNPMPSPPSGPMGSSPARQLLQSLGLG